MPRKAAALSTRPFAEALGELLRENDYTTQTGNVNWHGFARELEDVHYETLRKALTGERGVSQHMMEECARVLRVKPEYFVEWRIAEAARAFDVREVGFDAALENLETWAKAHDPAARSARRT